MAEWRTYPQEGEIKMTYWQNPKLNPKQDSSCSSKNRRNPRFTAVTRKHL